MKAILYARTSSSGYLKNRQNQEPQLNNIHLYAKENNIEIVQEFCEQISGGKSNRERKVLMECLAYAQNNNIDLILFNSLDRLGRNILEVFEVVKILKDNQINAYFVKEKINILDENGQVTPMTSMLLNCLTLVGEIERENIKFRLNLGREYARNVKRVKFGRPTGTKMTSTDKQKKYNRPIALLRKGLNVSEVLKICKQEGVKVGEATLWKLKKEFC
ncbi:MAG: recombinase family protein [Bacteroidales bacterium]|nr:recombinase family protein [Bacteroidales bacterium]